MNRKTIIIAEVRDIWQMSALSFGEKMEIDLLVSYMILTLQVRKK